MPDKDNVAASDNKRLGKFDRLPIMKLALEWLASPPKPSGKTPAPAPGDPSKKKFYLELDDCDLHTPTCSFVFADDLMKMFRLCYKELVGVEVTNKCSLVFCCLLTVSFAAECQCSGVVFVLCALENGAAASVGAASVEHLERQGGHGLEFVRHNHPQGLVQARSSKEEMKAINRFFETLRRVFLCGWSA